MCSGLPPRKMVNVRSRQQRSFASEPERRHPSEAAIGAPGVIG